MNALSGSMLFSIGPMLTYELTVRPYLSHEFRPPEALMSDSNNLEIRLRIIPAIMITYKQSHNFEDISIHAFLELPSKYLLLKRF